MFGHNLPGIYIALEGIRCCGKSTQARLLAEKLQKEFPGREILLTGEVLTPWAEIYLFAASRAQSIARLIKPSLERGAIIISEIFRWNYRPKEWR